jgi:hypothetical protein
MVNFENLTGKVNYNALSVKFLKCYYVMRIEKYDIISLGNFDYQFFSKGKNGTVEKRITFSPASIPNYYRLSFGDVIDGYIEEDTRTGNQDAELTIGTVAWCVILFTHRANKPRVKFSGLTKARTRLFAIWINKHIDELLKYLHIYGYCNGRCEKFRSNKQYDAFLVTSK